MPELPSDADRQFAVEVVRALRGAGYQAYWAGGCVRDQLLGRTPKDYDVATDALPEQIRELFGYRRTIAIGAAFGVITVLGRRPAGPIEVATFRQDAMYSDGRHPDAVTFSSPAEDALRRDFTINGLFYDPLEDQVIDFVDGVADLRDRVIRAIGNPHERIAEDKLRMLRAVRFAATFDFALEQETLAAVQQHCAEIEIVSTERIAAELRRMLAHPQRATALGLLRRSGLLAFILPEIAPLLADEPADEPWQRLLRVEAALETDDFSVALAGVLHALISDAGVATADLETICRRWKLAGEETRRATWLASNVDQARRAAQLPWPQLQRLLVAEEGPRLVLLAAAIAAVRGDSPEHLALCQAKLALPAAELDPPLLISGDHLKQLAIPPGPIYGRLLTAVRDAQLEGELSTTEEALRWVAEHWQSLA